MDDETRVALAELRKREKMRSWVSVLFILAILAGIRLLTMLACVLWIVYLLYCVRHAEDRGGRITNWIIMALPVGVFLVNLTRMIIE